MNPTLRRVLQRIWDRRVRLVVAGGAGVGGLAGSYAVAGYTPEFVAGPVAGFLARNMPAPIVSFGIVVLGDLGFQLNVLTAIGLSVVGLAAAAYAGLALGERPEVPVIGPLSGVTIACTAVAFLVTFAGLPSVGTGLSAAIVVGIAQLLPPEGVGGHQPSRRRVISGIAGTATVGLLGYVLGSRGGLYGRPSGSDEELSDPRVTGEVASLLAEADDKSLEVLGLEPLVSTNFYEVDINATNPRIQADQWELRVTGDVGQEVRYTYDEIRQMQPETRFVSLQCVGDSLNGKKLDNALWTGVPIADLIEPADVPDNCCVMLRAADEYFEEFPLPALQDSLLAYGMNGRTLPIGHGYPARALIPGRWGEVNVKWITEIEILEAPEDGYWEQNGWEGTGPVHTIAKLHVLNDDRDDGRFEVAGHAYAGTRGVERVEVSIDGGESWTDATLSDPLPGDDVWRQWVHRYDPPDETHEVVVRATDGTGTRQTQKRQDSFPSGPTGWVSLEVRP